MYKPYYSSYHRIIIHPGKIFRAKDLIDLSMIHFPQKNAKQMRMAFRIIYCAIRFSSDQCILWGEVRAFVDELKQCNDIKVNISQSTLCKARKRMRKAGIIEYRNSGWRFSSRITKSLERLSDLHRALQIPINSKVERDKEIHNLLFEL